MDGLRVVVLVGEQRRVDLAREAERVAVRARGHLGAAEGDADRAELFLVDRRDVLLRRVIGGGELSERARDVLQAAGADGGREIEVGSGERVGEVDAEAGGEGAVGVGERVEEDREACGRREVVGPGERERGGGDVAEVVQRDAEGGLDDGASAERGKREIDGLGAICGDGRAVRAARDREAGLALGVGADVEVGDVLARERDALGDERERGADKVGVEAACV